MLSLLAASLALLSVVRSTPQPRGDYDALAGTSCTTYSIPITVSSTNNIFAYQFKDDFDLAQFNADLGTRDLAIGFRPISGQVNSTANYTIAGTFCTPTNRKGGHEKTVLLASHGLGFERSYWDFPEQPETYSFKNYVISQGYSIFYYDRLGTGESTNFDHRGLTDWARVSGYVNQASIQIAILEELVRSIKTGRYTGSLGKPNSIVLVGHSFGSFISQGLVVSHPEAVDGLVLTGIGYAGGNSQLVWETYQLRIAAQQHESQFTGLDNGYVLPVDLFAYITTFFKQPNYETDVAQYSYDKRQPMAVAELLSLSAINLNADHFSGPAMVLTGEYDYILCGGYCPGVLEGPAAALFNRSKNFVLYIQPGMSHGLNLHKNATGVYLVIVDFLRENGF